MDLRRYGHHKSRNVALRIRVVRPPNLLGEAEEPGVVLSMPCFVSADERVPQVGRGWRGDVVLEAPVLLGSEGVACDVRDPPTFALSPQR